MAEHVIYAVYINDVRSADTVVLDLLEAKERFKVGGIKTFNIGGSNHSQPPFSRLNIVIAGEITIHTVISPDNGGTSEGGGVEVFFMKFLNIGEIYAVFSHCDTGTVSPGWNGGRGIVVSIGKIGLEVT